MQFNPSPGSVSIDLRGLLESAFLIRMLEDITLRTDMLSKLELWCSGDPVFSEV